METEPVRKFKSRIAGKNSDVEIYRDRIEWYQHSSITRSRKGSEMIPVRSISSVTTRKDGLVFAEVSVITSGNSIDFRVSKPEAKEIAELIHRLVLDPDSVPRSSGGAPTSSYIAARNAGASPAEASGVTPPPPPPPVRSTPVPMPPGTPAGWHPDPVGGHELRYWDGGRWTEHVSTAGTQSTSPI